MERTKAFVVDARLLQLDMAADHLDDVDTRKKVLDEARWNHAVSLTKRLFRMEWRSVCRCALNCPENKKAAQVAAFLRINETSNIRRQNR